MENGNDAGDELLADDGTDIETVKWLGGLHDLYSGI